MKHRNRFGFGWLIVFGGLTLGHLTIAAEPQKSTAVLSIAPAPLGDALTAFAQQSGVQIILDAQLAEGVRSPGVTGTLNVQTAIEKLLEQTSFGAEWLDGHTIAIRPLKLKQKSDSKASSVTLEDEAAAQLHLAQGQPAAQSVTAPKPSKEDADSGSKGIPEILVKGSKLLNMDIKRTRDDAQPYVIFEREVILNSGATNLEDFFKQRLPMNTAASSFGQQQANGLQGTSQVNLRGFGTNQTLILVNGHRTSGVANGSIVQQADLNGIPLAAIERIEVLPTSASGIYGGGATGGVVNVILRQDYSGVELKLTYDNTFDTDSASRRVDIAAGFALEEGKTNILISSSLSRANDLWREDRNLYDQGIERILSNNPSFFATGTTPPLGFTPNIRSSTGVNLTLRNGTPLNSPITFVPVGYAGFSSDNGAALVSNAGKYNLALADTAQTGSNATGGGHYSMVSRPLVDSVNATVRREFGKNIQAFLEFAAADNESHLHYNGSPSSFTIAAGAANNPFSQAIRVAVPAALNDGELVTHSGNRRMVGGVIVALPKQWRIESDYTWDRSRLYVTGPPGLSSTASALDLVRDINARPLDFSPYQVAGTRVTPSLSTLKDTTLRVGGPIFRLPAGPAAFSSVLEHREEDIGENTTILDPTLASYSPSRSQRIDSLYAEMLIPMVSSKNSIPGIKLLELQLAARRDDYRINGSTGSFIFFGALPATLPVPVRVTNKTTSTDPSIGLRFAPVDDLMLRASYSTGFLPAGLAQLVSSASVPGTVTDPLRGNANYSVPQITGGNANLTPEKSRSTSFGLIYTPRQLTGLRAAVDYTRVRKTDNIVNLASSVLLANESLFPGRIVRGANVQGDAAGWAGPITLIDASAVNIAQASIEAFDVALDYGLETSAGKWSVFSSATWQTHYETRLLPTVALVENIGINGGVTTGIPLKFKGNAGVSWEKSNWTVGWATRYFDSYQVADPSVPTNAARIANQGNGGVVSSQIYHDVFARFLLGSAAAHSNTPRTLPGSLLQSTELMFGVRNVFGRKPPFDAGNVVAYYSPFGDARLSSYYVSFKKTF